MVPSKLWPLFFIVANSDGSAGVKPQNDVVQFLQQLGHPQYAVPLASSRFASMKEPCLINSSGLQKCGILDGHALRILLHQHSQVRGLQTSCVIARNGWPKDIRRRAPALHGRHP